MSEKWIDVVPRHKETFRAIKWTGDNLNEIQHFIKHAEDDGHGTLSGLSDGTARPGTWILIDP